MYLAASSLSVPASELNRYAVADSSSPWRLARGSEKLDSVIPQ